MLPTSYIHFLRHRTYLTKLYLVLFHVRQLVLAAHHRLLRSTVSLWSIGKILFQALTVVGKQIQMPAVQAKDAELQEAFGFDEAEVWTRFNCDTMCWMYYRDKQLFDGPQRRPKLFRTCAEELLEATGLLVEPIAHMQRYLEANTELGWEPVSVAQQDLKQGAKFWRLKYRSPEDQEELLRMVRGGSYASVRPTPLREGVTTRRMSQARGRRPGSYAYRSFVTQVPV